MTPADRKRLSSMQANSSFMAKADSANDLFLVGLEKEGILTCYDAMFGNNYYSLTARGECELFGIAA
jgi:hypothetical protein